MAEENVPNNGNQSPNEDDDEIIVFSLDDEKLNDLGKVIGTKYSREFLKIIQDKELNLKEIAKIIENNKNPRLPNPTHHKNRLEKIGLIVSRLKQQRKRGHVLNFYKGKKVIIIVPQEFVESVRNSAEIKNAIDNIFKS